MENSGHFVLVKEAAPPLSGANLVASVVEFRLPHKTRGTDFSCSLLIMDSSCEDSGLPVHVFAKDKANLPHVMSYGDIVCLKLVVIKCHNGEVFAQFDKKSSSFALFGGKACEDFKPYQASLNYLVTDHEKELIQQLRMWLLNNQFVAGVIVNEYLLKLRDIGLNKKLDLVCKILHVSEVPGEGWIVYIWDGTDCPPVCLSTDDRLTSEDAKPPLQLEQSPLERSVFCTFPCVGSVLRVTVDKTFEDLHLHMQPIGQWVKLRDITCEEQSGIWRGRVTTYTRLRPLVDEDKIVKKCQQEYNIRLSSNLNCLPLTSLPLVSNITETEHGRAKFSTLMDVLTHEKVTFKYKCLVRVVGANPWSVDDFCSPATGSYRIRFTLEDPTARIHACLFDKEGENFFGGFPPKHELRGKMNKLLGICEEQGPTSRNPPWVQCCILSFYLDKNDMWGSRRYWIIDTKLVG